MDQSFLIKDVKNFIDATRTMVFVNFAQDDNMSPIKIITLNDLTQKDQDELNGILSYDEALMIAKEHMKKQKNSKSSKIRYIISDSSYANMVTSMHSRMVSNILTKLVDKGVVETAFDAESNDFVFWVKDKGNEQQEKPETD